MTSFKPNENFAYYMYWVGERMKIFWSRYYENSYETKDPVLKNFKFTNVYRSLDRVSQFLIKEVIYKKNGHFFSDEDEVFRIILFKHFNKIQTWELIESEFGKIDLNLDLKRLDEFLTEVITVEPIYNNAYKMTASFMRSEEIIGKFGLKPGMRKHTSYLKFWSDFFEKDIQKTLDSQSFEELFNNLRGVVSMGDFLSMQYSIDLNYSNLFNFDENEFIIAGPGAVRGIQRTFEIQGKPDYVEIIKWVKSNWEELLAEYGIDFDPLPNRQPTLIDNQNGFCEVDKYLRGSGIQTEGIEVEGKRIKNHFDFKKSNTKEKINYFLPPKWGVILPKTF